MLMRVSEVIALRGTCQRAQVGAVLAQDGRIIATGYNGSPAGMPHCIDIGCEVVDGHCVRTAHAEAGAIAYAARKGLALEGATLYVTHTPCETCAKLIINAGVIEVVVGTPYGEGNGPTLLREAGIALWYDGGALFPEEVETE